MSCTLFGSWHLTSSADLCFGNSVDAIHAPDYAAPIIVAMDASLPAFVMFKHSSLLKNMIMKCPPAISKITSPATAGLVNLQLVSYLPCMGPPTMLTVSVQLLKQQIAEITNDPTQLEKLPHSTTIYHELLRPESFRSGQVPSRESLYEEAQALMFGGADTTGTTLMHGTFHMLTSPIVYKNLKEELLQSWPNISEPPSLQDLERLPYLVSFISHNTLCCFL